MRPVSSGKRGLSVFLGIALAVLGPLCGLTLNAQTTNPVPLINQPLVPDATAPGGPQFTLTINGTGFVSNSTVNWNGSPLVTTFISGSQLTAVVPAGDIATASTGWVTVVSPAPGGGTSNTAFFTATPNIGDSVAFTLASSPATGSYPYSVAVGDFNGDGKLDLAVANVCGSDPTCNSLSGTVSILLGDSKGNFTLASTLATGGWPTAVAVGDFNGDGKLDLAVSNCTILHCNGAPSEVSIFLGDGTGNFTLASSPPTGNWPVAVAVGDFNGDGNLDLAVANGGAGSASILLGDGTGTFTLASTPYVGADPWSLAVGDFSGDGVLDLAVVDLGTNNVVIMLGDGTGNFTLASSPATGNYPVSVAMGDFNGDGNLDLAVANYYGNTLSTLLGDGTGNFTLASSPAAGAWPTAVAPGDFNGDGILDLAVTSQSTATVSVLLGDGTGNFTLASSPAAGWGPYSVATGDFNGDGKLDLAVADNGGGTVSIVLQATPAVGLSPTSLTFGTQLFGTTSSAQTVTLTNTGGETLGITSIGASANFAQTNTCGSSLAAGASCNITVTFVPRGVGPLTGSITITDSASNSPQTVSLTGTGTVASLLPGSLNFGVLRVGASLTRTATLTNYSYRTLNISLVQFLPPAAGDFSQTNTCGTSVPAQSSCMFSITFTPQAKGSRKSTMGVIDNSGSSPQTVALSGTGE